MSNKPLHVNQKIIKPSEEEMNNAYIYFQDEYKYLSFNMKKNLEKMPNNKGYIQNGIQYYGKLKANPKHPIILFEKEGHTMFVHEITDYYYKKFEKENYNSERKLIFHKKKRKRFLKR